MAVSHALERRRAALCEPGTWLTGADRVAVAAEARAADACPLCAARRESISVNAVAGDHRKASDATPALVEIAHRVATDPSRITEAWYRSVAAEPLGEGGYVEAVAVVATLIALDTFARGIGAAPAPHPNPATGTPSRQRPDGARVNSAWVPTVDPELATAEVARFYGRRAEPPGNIARALSLVPSELLGFWELVDSMYTPYESFHDLGFRRTLDRVQIEVLAFRVSTLNRCFYCSAAHTKMLERAAGVSGIDSGMAEIVTGEYAAASEIPYRRELLEFASAVHSGTANTLDAARRELEAAAGPDAVAGAAAVVALFMAINRIASATGTRLDDRTEQGTQAWRAQLGIEEFRPDRGDR